MFSPEEVVVEPDVGVAVLLQPRLCLSVAVRGGARLDGPKVAGDPSAEVVNVVILNIHHPVSVALGGKYLANIGYSRSFPSRCYIRVYKINFFIKQ